MKKLISIFAVLAMVGALAAQKRKAPAKAPAKPAAVAAPAVPAAVTAPAPVVAAPAASGKGLGLSIEARGSWIQSHGTSDAKGTGDMSAATKTYELSNSNGFGGGLTIGYEIAKNLGIVGSYDYRSISTREWTTTKSVTLPAASPSVDSSSIQQTTKTQVIGIGLRPSVDAWGGKIYAGMGFAMVLPFENETTIELKNANFGGGAIANWKQVITSGWNLGLGVYAELGYNYTITDNLFAGVGIRGLIATSNNDGKKSTAVQTADAGIGGGNSTTETEYAASVSGTKKAFGSQSITDMTVSVTVGYRL